MTAYPPLTETDINALARMGLPRTSLDLPKENTVLRIAPISLREANRFVDALHRHHGPAQGHRFSVSVVDEHGEVHGVGIAGRPVSRVLQAEGYLEVLRICTDGSRNACSMLYGALRRAGIALGYPAERIITYTLASEEGGSLRAAGWHDDGPAGGGRWHRAARPRRDAAPIQTKRRWRAAPATR